MAIKCPNCGKTLHWYDFRAECKYCGANIPNYDWEGQLERDADIAEICGLSAWSARCCRLWRWSCRF